MSARDAGAPVLLLNKFNHAELFASFRKFTASRLYQRLIVVWLGVFCAGFSLLPAEWEQRWLFYVGIPLGLPAVVAASRRPGKGPLCWALGAFLLYSAISALWSDRWLTVGDEIRRAFWIGYFLLVCAFVGAHALRGLRAALRIVVVFAAAVAIYEVIDFVATCLDCGRFVGLGQHANSNTTASIAGTLALLGLSATLWRPRGASYLLLACQAPLCVLLISTGSRAALLSYFGGLFLSLALVARRARERLAGWVAAVLLGCIAVASVTIGLLGRGWMHTEIARGDTWRLQIWSENLRRIGQRPWFGHGATAWDLVRSDSGQIIGLHAHNLFLAQAFYGGVVGCALWVAVFGLALRVGWRVWRADGDMLPLVALVFLLGVGDLDIGAVVVDVSPVWCYVWVVLGIVVAFDVDLRRRAMTSP